MPVSDESIISMMMDEENKEQGMRLLLQKYQERVYWVVRRMVKRHEDADDLVQEIFIRIYQKINLYRGKASLFTWIYRIAVNEALSFLNREKRNLAVVGSDQLELAVDSSESAGPDAETIQNVLTEAVSRLPDRQRAVFTLRYYDGLKYEEMSGILDTSVGSLKASYHHAIKKVEDYVLKHAQLL